MEQLLVTVEDVKNEFDINLTEELDTQPKYVDKWLLRQQRTILNYIASSSGQSMESVEKLIEDEANKKVICDAILEHIGYVAANNYVEPNRVMSISAEHTVLPAIAPLAAEMLRNAGLLGENRG